MKILDFLDPSCITLNLKEKDKKRVIIEMVNLLHKNKKIKDVNKCVQTVIEREKIGTTGIGQGIAIPHGRTDAVDKTIAALGISKDGVDFESLDGEKVHLIFLILSPIDSVAQHLRAISLAASLFKDSFVRRSLMDAKSTEEIIKIIKQEEGGR